MSYLFEFGEFLLCFGPVFLIIGSIGAVLLWNSLPERGPKKRKDKDDENLAVEDDSKA